jgi:hypothetical protein
LIKSFYPEPEEKIFFHCYTGLVVPLCLTWLSALRAKPGQKP